MHSAPRLCENLQDTALISHSHVGVTESPRYNSFLSFGFVCALDGTLPIFPKVYIFLDSKYIYYFITDKNFCVIRYSKRANYWQGSQ